MAESFNAGKKSVRGNVVNDPEEVETPNGTLVAFRLADNKRFYDRQTQQWKDAKPTYYDVGINKERLQANVLASVEKGQQVTVEGNHQVQAFTHNNGDAGIGHRLYATDVSASLEWDSLQRQPAANTAETDAAASVSGQQGPQNPGGEQFINAAAFSGQAAQQTQPQPERTTEVPAPQTPEAEAIRRQAEQSWAQSPTQAGPAVG